MSRFLLLTIAALLLGACAKEYRFVPPNNPQGQQCVINCLNVQAACHQREDGRSEQHNQICNAEYQEEKANCEHDADLEYTACLKYTKGEAERNKNCKRKHCKIRSCAKRVNYRQCDKSHRICFQTCGGTVTEVE